MKKYRVKGTIVNSESTIHTYDSDIVDEMTKILSKELAKNREILKNLGILGRNVRKKVSIKKIYGLEKTT